MRITMQSIYANILTNLDKITTDMNRTNTQISSGKQMSTISDNPVNMVTALRLRSSLSQIAMYQDNLTFGDKSITSAESSLTQMKDLTLRAKVLGLQQANASVSPQNRASAAEEVRNLWEEAIALANSKVNGKYVFGGYRTTGYTETEPEPFVADLASGYRVNGKALAAVNFAALPEYDLAAGDLTINGISIASTGGDGSATAKAGVINDATDTTGVSAEITPAFHAATVATGAGSLGVGDLSINGQDIFAAPTAILAQDTDNTLVNAINAKTDLTGVIASRDSSGKLSLAAEDGSNIRIITTANGEAVSQLNGAAADMVYFGTVQLLSARPFTLESTTITEPGLVALGLDGGSATTSEVDDLAADGLLTVITIQQQEDNVRYAGDPDNNLAIKIGGTSTLEVSKNGKTAIADTGIFVMLKKLQDSLLGQNFSSVTGLNTATDTTAKLDSGDTGLEQQAQSFTSGIIAFTVTDHAYYPPLTNTTRDVGVDIAADSPADIAARINGIPGMSASWDAAGQLQLATTDPERYTFTYTDTSNFLEMSGITSDAMQVQAINQATADSDTVMDNLSSQISDFGARANRIIVQQQIYANLELATRENLSEKEDTDMVKALLELKSKETAYQAALAAAAKTMQLSLVDFLK
jgi:flagellar hook-associated protein 3 FlgL